MSLQDASGLEGPPRRLPAGSTGYFLFFLLLFLALTALVIWPIFPYIVLAALLAFLLQPLDEMLRKRVVSSAARAGLMTAFLIIAIAIPLLFAIRKSVDELTSPSAFSHAGQYLDHLRSWLISHRARSLADWVRDGLDSGRQSILQSIPGAFGSFIDVLAGLFVLLFSFYYFAKEGDRIWRTFLTTIPLPLELKGEVGDLLRGIVRAIMYGHFLVAILQGAASGLSYVIFRVPEAALLTLLTMIAGFFPVIGAPLIWVPVGLIKLGEGHTGEGIGVLVYGFAIVSNIDHFLRPKLISMHSEVHPIVVLTGLIGGVKIFGFIGFFVGPIVFAVFIQFLRFFVEHRVAQPATSAPME